MNMQNDPIMRRYGTKEDESSVDTVTEEGGEAVQEAAPVKEQAEEQPAKEEQGKEQSVSSGEEQQSESVANDFNAKMKELFETDDVELLRQKLELANKYDEMDGKYKATQENLDAYQKFLDEAIDPSNYFATDEGMFVENAKKKFPTLNYSTASMLIEQDAKDMSPLRALVLNELVENADVGLSESEAEHIVLQDLNLDKSDVEDMDKDSTEYKNLLIKAKKAKRNLASVQDEAKQLPERQTLVDFVENHKKSRDEAKSAVRQEWEQKLPELKERLKTLTVKDGEGDVYTYEIPDSWFDGQAEQLFATVQKNGLKPDSAGIQEAVSNLEAFYLNENRAKVFRAFEKDLRSKWQVETDEKYGTQKPSGVTKETAVSQETKTDWGAMKPPRKKFVI